MGARKALGSSVHSPTPIAKRQISLVGLHSINVQVCECAFTFHREQKRYHFGAVAIDVHRMFRHDSMST